MSDEFYIKKCIDLAKKGSGMVSPNPMVGCVIIRDGKIIGEGWHRVYGGAHAEVNAIESVTDKSLLAKSTLYVNLEPCSHWGKTPPCCDLIIKHNIQKVVIGMIDPFSEVCGEGVLKLRNAGIDVHVGILEDECRYLNRIFVTYNTKKRPYIVLKWAETRDGYLDNNRNADTPATWMTGSECKKMVHQRRSELSAIMTGTNTIIRDNPTLTVRVCEGKNPIRVVIDKNLRISSNANIFNGEAKTILFTKPENIENARKRYPDCVIAEYGTLEDIIDSLYMRGIDSVYVEGGAALLNSFIEKELWDEANIFTSNLGVSDLKGGTTAEPKGVLAPEISGIVKYEKTIDKVEYSVILSTQQT